MAEDAGALSEDSVIVKLKMCCRWFILSSQLFSFIYLKRKKEVEPNTECDHGRKQNITLEFGATLLWALPVEQVSYIMVGSPQADPCPC